MYAEICYKLKVCCAVCCCVSDGDRPLAFLIRLSRGSYSIWREGTGEGSGVGSRTLMTGVGGLGGGSGSLSHTRSGAIEHTI